MSTSKTLFQRPVFWVATVALGVGGFVMTSPDAPKSSKAAPPKARKSTVANAKEDVYTKEDETAVFKPVSSDAKNSFRPIVAKSGIGSGSSASMLPTELTSGEPNWVYTGSAETDGSQVALIENRTSGEAVFLKRGQRWKSSYVVKIEPDSIVLKGPYGDRTLGIAQDEPATTSRSTVASSGTAANANAPMGVNVPRNMRGPIGQAYGYQNGNQNGYPNGATAYPDQGYQPGQQDFQGPGDNNEN